MRRALLVMLLAAIGAGLIAYGVNVELTIRASLATESGATMRRVWVSLSPSAREHLASWHVLAWSAIAGGTLLLASSHAIAWRARRSRARAKK